ncbi:hypothetical protein N0V90_012486 [Kalmusia sp. IMI 367209]|nr:hypothetical protein N0V90_012486 [Kalmusia sp. IMI 367209]
MAERTDTCLLSTEGLSYLTMLYAATGVSGSDPTLPLHINEALSGSLAELRQNRLPEIDMNSPEMRAAFQRYVEMIGQYFPYMNSSELSERRESVVPTTRGDTASQPSAEHLVIVYLGTATGLLLGSHYMYKEMLATDLAIRAVRLMPKVLDYAGKLSAIRCLTALTIFSVYTTFGGSTWHLLGLTMTRSISAGMHTTRFSDGGSQNGEQRACSRLLWTLYILDTYISASLDRPFCLNERDIMVSVCGTLQIETVVIANFLAKAPSSPSSRSSDASVEEATFRYLIQHAQILRSIRQSTNLDDGILCHFINIRHWKETLTPQTSLSMDRAIGLCSCTYVELLKSEIFFLDSHRASVLSQATEEFASYLDYLEEQLNAQSGAVASLEALHIFAIGVLLAMKTSQSVSFDSRAIQPDSNLQKMILQVQNVLTLLSTRYSVVRKFRDIISELHRCILGTSSRANLHALVAASELAVPRQIQTLLLGDV